MADIIVDTYKLSQYAQRIATVNNRINRLDRRLDSLYWRVGLQGLWNLMQADALVSHSLKLKRCKSYLEQTSADFKSTEKEIVSKDLCDFKRKKAVNEIFFNVGSAIKKSAKKVTKFTENIITDTLDSYYTHGKVFKAVEYGKAAFKAVKGVAKIVTGVGSLVASGGLSSPVAILSIISGGNDVYNALMDATYVTVGEYDKIGTNGLKEFLKNSAGDVGDLIGNRKVGEIFGEITYFGIDLVSSLAALDCSLDKIKQLSNTNFSHLGSELKSIAQLDITKIFTEDIETLRYQAKLASYTYKATTNFISNAGSLFVVAEKSVKVAKNIDDILTVGIPEEYTDNYVLEYFENAIDIKNKFFNVSKNINKLNQFLIKDKEK